MPCKHVHRAGLSCNGRHKANQLQTNRQLMREGARMSNSGTGHRARCLPATANGSCTTTSRSNNCEAASAHLDALHDRVERAKAGIRRRRRRTACWRRHCCERRKRRMTRCLAAAGKGRGAQLPQTQTRAAANGLPAAVVAEAPAERSSSDARRDDTPQRPSGCRAK